MELYSYTNTLASDSTLGVDVLANAFLCDASITHASPSLSVLSTPQLEPLDTPDTVVSHDFDVFSPHLQKYDHFNNFGQDRSIFEENCAGQGAFFGDTTLFPFEEDLTSSALFEKYESGLQQQSNVKSEVFVDASALTLEQPFDRALSANSCSSAPPSPASFVMPPPSFSRSSSNGSFAVPKLPRGRKRKATVGEDQEYLPKKASGTSRKPTSVEDDEDEEKIALRAKNTEAAARSRARKRAAMEAAEKRIRELEEENASLRALLTEKDVLLAVRQK